MNITSSVGYIICYVRWAEGYIPWHVELFRCHVHGYILLRNLQIQCVPPPPIPHNELARWFAANWKQSVFIYSSSGTPSASTHSERPADQLQRPYHRRLWLALPVGLTWYGVQALAAFGSVATIWLIKAHDLFGMRGVVRPYCWSHDQLGCHGQGTIRTAPRYLTLPR